ncbi:phosphatase PAP2 family protein [Methanimicrococcus blatticola]|uniref:Undecaprenyl-diphosphatase n=1 Tax=Methanimicrococcus blatticola TaxID=91560 RepID=A0A484F7F7_9EURY|nr:phosphatase PAP2 family protein [Methanimicrococcus blatticola]MBZ3935497.1 phosphatase PAP2 family protein [Methanimicrococcus blatticola]MCC2509140.1 phosphatase PAP2 family protein [Methanimicrococcus blatticola]TDQ69494.1 undecaprenyl-diphosphatase [Methanimicrococcus blatticola]
MFELIQLIQSFDFYIILQIYQTGGISFIDTVAVLFSYAGSLRLGALFLCLFFWMKKETRPITFILFSAVLLSAGITWIIKEIIDRPRPYIELGLTAADMLIRTDPTVSFPSGHTATAFTTATVVARYFKKWAIPALFLACLAGLSRIYLLVHYPSDVVAGALIGIMSAVFVIYFYQKIIQRMENEKLKIPFFEK